MTDMPRKAEPYVRLSVNLPVELDARLRGVTATTGESVTDLVRRILLQEIERVEEEQQ